jgi:hypothetical protein
MDSLTQHLQAMIGPGATFRDSQREAEEAMIDDGHRALVVQRTGWAKAWSIGSIGEAIIAAELVAIAARSGRKVAEAAAPYEQTELFDDLKE